MTSHQRSYVDHWIVEMRFEDMESLIKIQTEYLHNADILMNG